MSNVVELLPNNALCVDQESLVKRLHVFADQVAAGEFGEVERVCIVLDAEKVDYRVYGRPTAAAYTVGLLEWAKAKIMGVIG